MKNVNYNLGEFFSVLENAMEACVQHITIEMSNAVVKVII